MEAIVRAVTMGATARLLRRAGAAAPEHAVAAPVGSIAQTWIVADPVAERAVDPALAAALDTARVNAELAERAHARVAELEASLHQKEAALAAHARHATQELERARRELDAGAEALRSDAEQAGYAAGLQRGEQAGALTLADEVARVRALAPALDASRSQVLAEAHDMIVEVAFAAICRVLGEHGASREALQSMVRSLTSGALERDRLTLRLHPDDAALLLADGEFAEGARMVADHAVVLGGCMVDSATGTLDARLEHQVAALGKALLSARAARRASDEAA